MSTDVGAAGPEVLVSDPRTTRGGGFPLSAVVGMDDLRLALLLCAVSPAVGGVLVRGEKGTAKSTAVRALAALLPPVDVVVGCRFGCDPLAPDDRCPDGPHPVGAPTQERPARLVELPVGATEDRVLGALDVERALSEGVTAYEPGLLAAAHRGLLYVDEVNLLHDHLVDVLLDAAAMGRATVEREGVSASHASRFTLVGTMNPEEGELRPQLLDRFGLTVEVRASRDPQVRAEVVRRRLASDADPAAFAARFAEDERALAERIAAARRLVDDVELGDTALTQIASVCASFEVDGMRADIVTARAAVAHAAWQGRTRVTAEDVRVAARLALPHRRRRNPFDAPGLDEDQLSQALDDATPDDGPEGPDDEPPPPGGGDPDGGGPDDGSPDGGGGAPGDQQAPAPDGEAGQGDAAASPPEGSSGGQSSGAGGGGEQRAVDAGTPFRARLLTVAGTGAGESGRRSRALTRTGRTVGSRAPLPGEGSRPHVLATLRAAAPHQVARGRHPGGRAGLALRRADLRVAVREGREGNLVLFAVDASGSMAARRRMAEVKTAVLSLLLDAYQRRDKVGLVTFRGRAAELALPPTSSVEAAAARLQDLPTGGRTPLAEGLLRAHEVLRVEAVRDPRRRPLLVLVTDGRATAGDAALDRARAAAGLLAAAGTASVVVDCEDRRPGRPRLGLAGTIAADLGAELLDLGGVAADSLAAAVRDRTQPQGALAAAGTGRGVA